MYKSKGARLKIGLFGGTFDPIHCGHITTALLIQEALALDQVCMVPAGEPYLKNDKEVSSKKLRLAMVELAVANHERIFSADIEIRRTGPSYTLDTVMCFQKEGHDVVVVLGIDSVLSMPNWHNAEALWRHCRIVAVTRQGWDQGEIPQLLPDEAINGIDILELETPDISSSKIRSFVREGMAIDHLVPDSVACFIRENGLYL